MSYKFLDSQGLKRFFDNLKILLLEQNAYKLEWKSIRQTSVTVDFGSTKTYYIAIPQDYVALYFYIHYNSSNWANNFLPVFDGYKTKFTPFWQNELLQYNISVSTVSGERRLSFTIQNQLSNSDYTSTSFSVELYGLALEKA